VFIPGATLDSPIELPKHELEKFRKVLRLGTGDEIVVLPNDGTALRCQLDGKVAKAIERFSPDVESPLHLTLVQALPRGDKVDEVVRACASIGVAEFVFFPSERSVVRWDTEKLSAKLNRLATIAMESCELSFRTRLPRLSVAESLEAVLRRFPEAIVLSEVEGEERKLSSTGKNEVIVVGPEGGWAPREVELIGSRAVTLGPRVLRVEHAGAAAAAILLLT
jgi:16S rRNA (uracil1498-N3)-methyltransferase